MVYGKLGRIYVPTFNSQNGTIAREAFHLSIIHPVCIIKRGRLWRRLMCWM